ncbi:AGAP006277-PA-like protein [Anopheles sinensis]|uniref:AGAP006277-PA-like protein n=1 Tax=Anopheles sinensis TaxID=74873 RepID=A0A084WKE4_ANOSI|nr:AGAP006277-PA-like protein [Anopheles sinensis]
MTKVRTLQSLFASVLRRTQNLSKDNKSILANTDWKKLWVESGQLGSSGGRIDNHLDSSDSTLIDDGETGTNS